MSSAFAQLGAPRFICDALARRGINEPFAIQAATISDALEGRDLTGRAPTGSGKTLAFGIPLVASVGQAAPHRPRGLVLAPTRELADQIATELRSFAGKNRIGVVYGGVGYGAQERDLRKGVEIVVACPGRLEDLIQRKSMNLSDIEIVVIDEADRLADMGFLPAVRRILNLTPSSRQTVLFSATLEGEVGKLTKEYQTNPVRHEVGDSTPDITKAEHRFHQVERDGRVGAAADIAGGVYRAIVFCRTRHGADRLARQMSQRGVKAGAIHGGHAQNRRTRTLSQFAKGELQALVATDVAARGIHIDDLDAVIHFDPPEDHTTYVHRSGRTARAGRGGLVVSLLLPEQVGEARKMTRKLDLELELSTIDGAPDRIATVQQAVAEQGAPGSGPAQGQRSGRGGAEGSKSSRKPNRRKRGAKNGGPQGGRNQGDSAGGQKASTKAGANSGSSRSGTPRPKQKHRRGPKVNAGR